MFFTDERFAKTWRKQASSMDGLLRLVKAPLLAQAHGVVVEVGPGTGVNFMYFRPDIKWVGIETNRELRAAFSKHPDIPKHWQVYDTLSRVREGQADCVVSTIVLCSVPDVRGFLQEIKRVLKPGGLFLCIEHVGAPKGTIKRLLQYWSNPITRRIGGGCEGDRDIEVAVRMADFSSVERVFSSELALTRIPFYTSPVIALKAKK